MSPQQSRNDTRYQLINQNGQNPPAKPSSSASEQSAGSPARRAAHAKPARNAAASDPHLRTRRSFLKLGTSVLGVFTLAEITGTSLLFLQPRSLEGEFGGTLNAGPADSFPNGSVTEFPAGRFFLIRTDDGGFLAAYRRCTHLGCSVSWEADQDKFVCPCHGSHFDFHGNVENPPAPTALDIFPLQIVDGDVQFDTGRAQSRDAFEPAQLVYA
jgi:cytochrome b6-f complex iron-sulfur subunit